MHKKTTHFAEDSKYARTRKETQSATHKYTHTHLFSGLVKHFTLLAERTTFLDKLVKVFTTLKYRIDRVVQHNLGIV